MKSATNGPSMSDMITANVLMKKSYLYAKSLMNHIPTHLVSSLRYFIVPRSNIFCMPVSRQGVLLCI